MSPTNELAEDSPDRRKAGRRWAIKMWLALLAIDLFTLGLAVVVANQQQHTLDSLHDGLCRNSGIIAGGLKGQIAQQQNVRVYRQYFPDIPLSQLRAQIAIQVSQERDQISRLQSGCS